MGRPVVPSPALRPFRAHRPRPVLRLEPAQVRRQRRHRQRHEDLRLRQEVDVVKCFACSRLELVFVMKNKMN